MIPVSEEMKHLLMLDRVEKQLIVSFTYKGAAAPFLILGNEQIVSESLRIDESLCSGEEILFGSCESSSAELTVTNVEEDIKGSIMRITLSIKGNEMPLGCYIVDSVKRQTNLIFKDITAYDFMTLFDVDVTEWYKSLEFPTTVKAMRQSLCQHIGISEMVPDYLPNDELQVERTIEPTTLLGRNVLKALEEINGVFGHFDRDGVLRHIALSPGYGLYPSNNLFMKDMVGLYPNNTLYPSNRRPVMPKGLYPQSNTDKSYKILAELAEKVNPEQYANQAVKFEEYTTLEIDKIRICQESGDIGAIVGSGTNAYTIKGNFLVFGKNATELKSIAKAVSGIIYKRPYRPYTAEIRGLPYIEVGDAITFNNDVISYVLTRSLSGITALQDSFSASGSETRSETTTVNEQIIQLDGRAAFLKKNVDEVSVKVIDLGEKTEAQLKVVTNEVSAEVKRAQEAEGKISLKADSLTTQIKNLADETNSKITQTAAGIRSDVENLRDNTNSKFEQTAKSIGLKVDIAGVISSINLSKESIKIDASKINLNGLTEFTTSGSDEKITVANGKITFFHPSTGAAVASVSSVYKSAGSTVRGLALYGEPDGAYISIGKMNTNGTFSYYYQVSLNTSSGTYNVHTFNGGVHMLNTLQVDKSTTIKGPLYVNDSTIGLRVNGTDVSLSGHKHSYLYNSDSSRYVRLYGTQFLPDVSSRIQIGSSVSRYSYIYLTNQPDVSSDRRLKDNIIPIDAETAKAMVMAVEPQFYTRKDDPGRQLQSGFIAQDVEAAALACGLEKYAGYSKHVTGNSLADKDYIYGLKYEALEAFMWSLLRDHEKRLKEAGI